MPNRFRLAAVTSHPVQYQAPLFQHLAQHPQIDLTVYYGHDGSVTGELDREFGIPIVWDRPLLDGYRSKFLSSRASRLDQWLGIAGKAAIVGHLSRGRYDAVFIHSYATALSLLTYLGAWISRTPILLRTESHRLRPRSAGVEWLKKPVLSALFRWTDAFLTIGQANRQFFLYYGVDDSRMFSTPYCVDNDYLSEQAQIHIPNKAAVMQRTGLKSDRPVIAFSGKLIERKRVQDLIRALDILATQGLAATLLVIGDGPLRDELTTIAAEANIDAVFVGFQNQTQLARYYVCADALVHPVQQRDVGARIERGDGAWATCCHHDTSWREPRSGDS